MSSFSLRAYASLGLLLAGGVGCAVPAASEEEKATTTSNLSDRREEAEPLEVGTTLVLRLSVNIRSELLPKAKLSDSGPNQAINYGARPNMLFIANGEVTSDADAGGGWLCEIRGTRPRPGMNERYFAPILPNPIRLAVLSRPLGTAGVGISLRSPAPDANDTTWSVDCSKDADEARGASLAELNDAFDSGSGALLD